jgi:gamma-glutamylcyclotransferase (GGCT)/AIG2-like uncharacterized protein YtfP
MSEQHPALRIFVYGTLKQGFHNYARYCRGVLSIERAVTLGRLYGLPQGYPMLDVPADRAFAMGTDDYLADVATQLRIAAAWASEPPTLVDYPQPDWDEISGEVLTFDDPLTRLPPLDRLEDFRPGNVSMYHRVIVPVWSPNLEPVWTYVAPDGRLPPEARRIGPVWP